VPSLAILVSAVLVFIVRTDRQTHRIRCMHRRGSSLYSRRRDVSNDTKIRNIKGEHGKIKYHSSTYSILNYPRTNYPRFSIQRRTHIAKAGNVRVQFCANAEPYHPPRQRSQ